MKSIVRKIVKAIPPLYRHINRRRGWRIHDADNPLPTVTIGGDGGPHNYGAWDIPRDFRLSPDSIVYSAGIGFDISFDLEIIRRFGCNVYTFDPGEEVVKFLETKRVPKQFKFQQVALGIFDGMHAFTKSAVNSYSVSDPGNEKS